MGWVLVHDVDKRELRIRPGKIQIGRAQDSPIRPSHQSVSRIHAEIVVKPHTGILSEPTPLHIEIIDRSSTGHTFVNQQPGKGKGVPVTLTHGDNLSFGVDPETYTVKWSPVILSFSSRLSASESTTLEGLARAAGAFMVSEWTPDCTHLLIDCLAFTPKLLCCIIDGGMPVALSFLQALATLEQAKPLPGAEAHRPNPPEGPDANYANELEEALARPYARKGLLQNVWVIFTSRQIYDDLSRAMRHAGSPVQLLCDSSSQVHQVKADLEANLRSQQMPSEVWVLPGAAANYAEALHNTLGSLKARCMQVSLPLVLKCLFLGNLDATKGDTCNSLAGTLYEKKEEDKHAPSLVAAVPLAGGAAAAGDSKVRGAANGRIRRTMPWAAGALVAPKEEDSFPLTLKQPVIASLDRPVEAKEVKTGGAADAAAAVGVAGGAASQRVATRLTSKRSMPSQPGPADAAVAEGPAAKRPRQATLDASLGLAPASIPRPEQAVPVATLAPASSSAAQKPMHDQSVKQAEKPDPSGGNATAAASNAPAVSSTAAAGSRGPQSRPAPGLKEVKLERSDSKKPVMDGPELQQAPKERRLRSKGSVATLPNTGSGAVASIQQVVPSVPLSISTSQGGGVGTALSQAKLEQEIAAGVALRADSAKPAQAAVKAEAADPGHPASQAKREAPAALEPSLVQPSLAPSLIMKDDPLPNAQVKSSRERGMPDVGDVAVTAAAVAPPPPPQPVQHPTGVWLGSLGDRSLLTTKQEDEATVHVDGVDVPRAAWRPVADPVVRRLAAEPSNAVSRKAAGEPQGPRSSRATRNYKLFSKAPGQRAAPRAARVVVSVWTPATERPLGELFGTQVFDSQGELPPLNL